MLFQPISYMFVHIVHTYKSHTNKQKLRSNTIHTNNSKVPDVHFATSKLTHVVRSAIYV